MPLGKEGMESLSNRELLDILGLESFKNQKWALREELLTRCNLDPVTFRKLHTTSECDLGFVVLGSRPSGLKDVDFMIDKPMFKLQIRCTKHEVVSEIFDDFNFPEGLKQLG